MAQSKKCKLSHLSQKQLLHLVDSLLQSRYLQLTGGKLPVLGLTSLGVKALETRAALPIQLPELAAADPTKDTSVGSTVRQTLTMFRQGRTPSQIAQERNLTEMTVYNHLADLIKQGEIELHEIVSPEIEVQVKQAADRAGRERLSPIKGLLPESVSFDQIKCVLAAEKRDPPTTQPSFIDMVPTKQSLPPQQAAEKLEALRQWRTEEAQKAQMPPYIIFSNKVLEAIVQQNPQSLSELGAIKGIGPAKLESYGNAVLSIMQSTAAATAPLQQLTSHPEAISRPAPEADLPSINPSAIDQTDDIATVIRKVVSDLEGLLTPQTLTSLLTAGPDKVVPFSDHQARGCFFGSVEEEAIDQEIRKMMAAQVIGVNRRQRLIVKKAPES